MRLLKQVVCAVERLVSAAINDHVLDYEHFLLTPDWNDLQILRGFFCHIHKAN